MIKKLQYVLPFLYFLAGILALFVGISSTSLYGDEAYQALCVRFYCDSPLAMMIFYIGNLWTNVFGDSFLSLRILARLCYLFAIGIGSIYLFERIKNIRITSIIFLFGCLIAAIGGFDIYNWDTGNYPITALTIVLILKYVEKPSIKTTLICSIIIALMPLFRITNIIFVLLWPCLIFIINKRNKYGNSIALILSIIFLTIITWITCTLIMTGSINNYISSFSKNNIISGHSISDINIWIWRFKYLFPLRSSHWIPIVVCFICAVLVYRIKFHYKLMDCIASLICMLSGWCSLKLVGMIFGYSGPLFTIGFPAIIIILSYIPYKAFISNNSSFEILTNINSFYIQSIVLLLFIILQGIGSDAMFERWNSSYALPISVGLIWHKLNKNDLKLFHLWFKYSFISIFTIFIFKTYHTQKEFIHSETNYAKMQKINIPIEFDETYSQIDSIIKSFPTNEKYCFWGIHGKPLTYCYETEPVFPIQLFNPQIKDSLILSHNWHKTDWIFIVKNPEKNESDSELYMYISQKFKIHKETEGFILFHKLYKSNDKKQSK